MSNAQPFVNRVSEITAQHANFSVYLYDEKFDTVQIGMDYEDKHFALVFSRLTHDMSPPMTLEEAQRLAFNTAPSVTAFLGAANGIEQGVEGLPEHIRQEYEKSHRVFEETAQEVAKRFAWEYQRYDKQVKLTRIANNLTADGKQALKQAANAHSFEIPMIDIPVRWEHLPDFFERFNNEKFVPFVEAVRHWVGFEKQGLIEVTPYWNGYIGHVTSDGMRVADELGLLATPARADTETADD